MKENQQSAERKKILTDCLFRAECGGCLGIPSAYGEQLKIKQCRTEALLKKYADVQPILGMNYPFCYRNKVHAVFGQKRNGQVICGTYQEGTHRIIDIDECMIQDRSSTAVIRLVKELLTSFKIRPYNEDTGRGLLRHVLIRKGFATGQMMVVLVTASPVFPSSGNFVRALLNKYPQITTVVQNINDRKTSMVLGEREKILYGNGYIEDRLLGCSFRISSRSFYQVNPVQTKQLYRTAISFAGLTGKEKVLDAYCGIGTIGLIAAKDAGQVIAVERNSDAVKDAIGNAKKNRVSNIRFVHQDAGAFMVRAAAGGERFDVVFTDPPRSGCSPEFLNALLTLSPERVVYVSCNPQTLARDLEVLKEKYRVERIQPVDMFPFTEHVETVVRMQRTEK